MILLIIIICLPFAIAELIICGFGRHIEKKRRNETIKYLYKLMENRVLSKTLCRKISKEQAAAEEYQSAFLRIEFPDTKPWLAGIFPLDETITIGRSRENVISVRDAMVSRMHCKIAVVGQNLYLQDMGSANGTKVRHGLFHKRTLGHQETEQLRDRDMIILGNCRMRIRIFNGSEVRV